MEVATPASEDGVPRSARPVRQRAAAARAAAAGGIVGKVERVKRKNAALVSTQSKLTMTAADYKRFRVCIEKGEPLSNEKGKSLLKKTEKWLKGFDMVVQSRPLSTADRRASIKRWISGPRARRVARIRSGRPVKKRYSDRALYASVRLRDSKNVFLPQSDEQRRLAMERLQQLRN